jgi:hypothetical protein
MRILFDHNVPLPLRQFLRIHEVATTAEQGWDRLANGKLLDAAEGAAFDILLTADKGFQHEQNLSRRRVAVLILSRGNWPEVKVHTANILEALRKCQPGTCSVVECCLSE